MDLDRLVKLAKITFVIIGTVWCLICLLGLICIPNWYYHPVKGIITGEMSDLQNEPILQFVFNNGYYPFVCLITGYGIYWLGSMVLVTAISLRD